MSLSKQDLATRLADLDGWQLTDDQSGIQRDFRFKNFHQTMAFVNAIAWIAHEEDHHPDLEVGYNHCLVNYTTHSQGGLTEKDFVCAQKVDALLHKA